MDRNLPEVRENLIVIIVLPLHPVRLKADKHNSICILSDVYNVYKDGKEGKRGKIRGIRGKKGEKREKRGKKEKKRKNVKRGINREHKRKKVSHMYLVGR